MKILVLHSGGMDSTVCLLLAKTVTSDVISLGINYGQKHEIEMAYAKAQCIKYEIPRKIVNVTWDKPTREIPLDRLPSQMPQKISSAFLPGRNLLFLSIAGAEAAGLMADEVWVGINCIDYSGYPDCTVEFFEEFKKLWKIAVPEGVKIVAPLLDQSKPMIARKAKELGLAKNETWSCYKPQVSPNGLAPCG